MRNSFPIHYRQRKQDSGIGAFEIARNAMYDFFYGSNVFILEDDHNHLIRLPAGVNKLAQRPEDRRCVVAVAFAQRREHPLAVHYRSAMEPGFHQFAKDRRHAFFMTGDMNE